MPRGRPRKVVVEEDPTLKGWESVEYTVAEILQARCGIKGCIPKLHIDEAKVLLKAFIQSGIIRERD